MSKVAEVSVARAEFERCLEVAYRIYAQVREQCVHGSESLSEGSSPATAQKIVGLAFVGIVAGWEDYLEGSFLRYMVGAKASNGYAPELRLGPCSSLQHARQVLGGHPNLASSARRTSWNEPKWVADVASIYFKDGAPFDLLKDELVRHRISTANVIRNRVVHNSDQAKRRFKEVANSLVGDQANAPLPHGFSPGRLLTYQGATTCFDASWISLKTDQWGDLFEAYVVMFYELSALITPL